MRGTKGVLHNLSMLTAGQVASQLLNVWALIYLTHHLGAHWFGVVQIGVTFMAYALITAEWGMFNLGIREVSRLDDSPGILTYVRSHMGIMAMQAIAVVAAGLVILPHLPFYKEDPWVFILYLMAVLPQVFMLYWVAVGLERMAWVGLTRTALSLFYALFVLVLLAPLEKLTGLGGHRLVPLFYLTAVVGSNLVIGVPLAKWFGKVLLPALPTIKEARRRGSEALPMGANVIVQRLLLNVDILLLGILSTPTVVGGYAAAMRIIFLLMVLIEVLWAALLPRFSRLSKTDPEGFGRAFNLYLGFVLAGLMPLAVGGYLVGPDLMLKLYGDKFPNSGVVFQVLAISYAMLAIGTFLGNTLISEDKQRQYFPPLVISAVVAVLANIILIPKFGGVGASLGMICSHFVLFAVLGFILRKRFSRQLGLVLMGLMPALLLMVLVIGALNSWTVYLRVIVAAATYLLAASWPLLRFRKLM